MTARGDERARCDSDDVGPSTRIGPFTLVCAGAVVGAECAIGSHCVVEPGARLGDRVTVSAGTQICTGVTLEDDVYVGSGVAFASSRFPRSGQAADPVEPTRVRTGASVASNATVLPGVEIGERAMVGAGAVVTRSVPRDAIVVGNPARIVGYVGAGDDAVMRPVRQEVTALGDDATTIETGVRGVVLQRLPAARDLRGSLIAGEFEERMPFTPRRWFMVFDVPGAHVRGEHAHRVCHQFLICVAGEVHVIADDGDNRQEFALEDKRTGLYLPPMTWGIQYRYSPESTLLVFASHPYDPDDYIRDYDEFLRELRARS